MQVARAWAAASVRNGGRRSPILPRPLWPGERECAERLKPGGGSTDAATPADRLVLVAKLL